MGVINITPDSFSDGGVHLLPERALAQARRLAGDIVLMHRGRVIETGPADEFFANPKSQDARRFIAGELLV